jgi:hypothetical protein
MSIGGTVKRRDQERDRAKDSDSQQEQAAAIPPHGDAEGRCQQRDRDIA